MEDILSGVLSYAVIVRATPEDPDHLRSSGKLSFRLNPLLDTQHTPHYHGPQEPAKPLRNERINAYIFARNMNEDVLTHHLEEEDWQDQRFNCAPCGLLVPCERARV